MAKKKVVILIVEGVSDERAISSIRKYVKESFGIYIHLTHGDVFSDTLNRKGIKAVVGDQVQKVMQQYKYTKNEILAVIQVTDTDGAFIPDEFVIIDENIGDKKLYCCDSIKVPNQQSAINIKQRNKIKASNLRTMYSTLKVQKTIDYYLLYFSCNLDHIIHDEMNLDNTEKDPKAREFDKKYKQKPNDFMEFFKNGTFVVQGSNKETWDFIQEGKNSLGQYSNFHLIFDILDKLIE
ncbi:hypothetical protein IIE26_19770 [Cytobacillus oceanisediminis]|uniref:hypothetical protein n=1 Tax=Cytobacillus oceanisediminis TaxID=665099 RepID=UPI001863DA45|nr:hypothetical protein [Cytobacillus oceanisediminis]QOK25896.1 hypothetical protein IIE26_19770 [Cytobacillus oceanisediminis]